MKNSIKVQTIAIASIGFAGVFGLSHSLLAQNMIPSWNVGSAVTNTGIFTDSADSCANLCGQSVMCASYTYRPAPEMRGSRGGGQCVFNRSSTPNYEQGAVSGLPTRGQISTISTPMPQASQAPAQYSNNTQSVNSNYAVRPLSNPQNYGAPHNPQMILNNPPVQQQAAPIAPQANNGASISFERNNAQANNNVAIQRPTAAQSAPRQVASAPVQQQPTRNVQVAMPSRTQAAAPTQTAVVARPQQVATNTAPMVQAAPSAPQNPNDINQYRGTDGMIDAAEMRRAQLRNQTAQAATPQSAPRYSVQNEWSNVAAAQANGQSQQSIDWANTRPVAQPQTASNGHNAQRARAAAASNNNQTQSAETEKKGIFSGIMGMFNREETETVQENSNSNAIGPLRKRSSR